MGEDAVVEAGVVEEEVGVVVLVELETPRLLLVAAALPCVTFSPSPQSPAAAQARGAALASVMEWPSEGAIGAGCAESFAHGWRAGRRNTATMRTILQCCADTQLTMAGQLHTHTHAISESLAASMCLPRVTLAWPHVHRGTLPNDRHVCHASGGSGRAGRPPLGTSRPWHTMGAHAHVAH